MFIEFYQFLILALEYELSKFMTVIGFKFSMHLVNSCRETQLLLTQSLSPLLDCVMALHLYFYHMRFVEEEYTQMQRQ